MAQPAGRTAPTTPTGGLFQPCCEDDKDLMTTLANGICGLICTHPIVVEMPRSPVSQFLRGVVKWIEPKHPGTFDLQNRLPNLPLPSLDHVRTLYLRTVRPLLTDPEYAATERAVNTYCDGQGKITHARLEAERKLRPNWLTPYWDKMYLANRSPLSMSSNIWGLGPIIPRRVEGEHPQAARAAYILHGLAQFREAVVHGTLKPDQPGGTPFCMEQFKHILGMYRVPGKGMDRLQHSPDNTYVIIIQAGRYWPINLYGDDHTPLSIEDIYTQIVYIKEQRYPEDPYSVGIYSLQNRDTWATDFETLNANSANQLPLKTLTSALGYIVLATDSWGSDTEAVAATMLSASNKLPDACVLMHISKDGNDLVADMDHTPADGIATQRMLSEVLLSEVPHGQKDATQTLVLPCPTANAHLPNPPTPLKFEVPDLMKLRAPKIQANYIKTHKGRTVEVRAFEKFGASFIQRHNLSPDSFMQVALSLAARYMLPRQKELSQIYETATTRAFFEARTETIRSALPEVLTFINSLEEATHSPEEKRALLKQAVEAHRNYKILAMAGQGVDRVLLAHQMIAQEGGGPPPSIFTDTAWNKPWYIASSQVPTKVTKAGGFWPIDPNGVGICYNILPELIIMNISSCQSTQNKSAAAFANAVTRALMTLKDLLTS
ncbi:MAG: hypothetical protein S4CHLAM102_09150 [Chlamydiia bacterium]|nr:hypothetical protein [Chlamydiia bacterium]